MTVQEILGLKSMYKASLIAGKNGTYKEISSVNILEATDISNWGRAGEVLLTSFFALQNLDGAELESFFDKLANIGISAIIIKLDRLLTHIPAKIIELCDKHLIPLIQIGKDVKYETIILEILGPVVNRNITLLNRYYDVHSELTSLALKRPSLDEIIREFKKMIQRDVSFINITKGKETTTNKELSNIIVLNNYELAAEKYMHFKYERRQVMYCDLPNKPLAMQIKVPVSYLGFDEYELVIHELTSPLTPEDFMVLENEVKFLQMELLKKFVVSQNIAQQKNNIISDLLNDRLYEEKDVDEVLESLNLNKYPYYQIIIIKLYPKNANKLLTNNFLPNILRKIKLKIKASFQDLVFMEKTDWIVFIKNFENKQHYITSSQLEKIIDVLSEDDLFNEFYYNISLSSQATKNAISRANREALDTQNILRLFHDSSKILAYEDLGIYKLFLDTNSLGELPKFISPKIYDFRTNYFLLFETLSTFLDTNQNYNLAAEKLFLHPKTVRYRIDKIKTILGIDFNNPEDILQIQVAARLFKLIDGRKPLV